MVNWNPNSAQIRRDLKEKILRFLSKKDNNDNEWKGVMKND